MITNETILAKLTEATHGTDKELYAPEQLSLFAFYLRRNDKIDEDTDGSEIAEMLVLFFDEFCEFGNPCRHCSECGRLFNEGYCLDGGSAYYCSDECLHKHYTDEEWAEECENNDQSYWTEW